MCSVYSPKQIAPIVLAALLFSLSACSEKETSTEKTPVARDPILVERTTRDAAFRSDPNSPILAQDRSKFQGLAYFPINPALRFSVRLNRYSRPERIKLGTNTGEIRSGLRYGYFEFQVEAQSCRLQVYRLEEVPESGGSGLFVPFRDATSGKESYAAGRYIDLVENTSGIYSLDFNRAYNPFCAYNSEFSCPIPPTENTLLIPIRAGEQKYSIGAIPVGFWLFTPGNQCYYFLTQSLQGDLCRQFLQI
jgi:uncharacterized protein